MTGGLRARTQAGVAHEVYAILIVLQALRTAMAGALLTEYDTPPDRLSFTTALSTAKDIVHCAAIIMKQHYSDLAGQIGRAALKAILPARRPRSCPE